MNFEEQVLREHCRGKSAEEVLTIVLKNSHGYGYTHDEAWNAAETLYDPPIFRRLVIKAMEIYSQEKSK